MPWFVAACARCPSLRHPATVVALHLSLCLGCSRQRASLACLVAPLWCAAPRPVRSLSVLRSALLTLWCLSPSRGLTPPDLLGGCAGHVEAGAEPGSLCLPLAAAEAAALGSLRIVPVRGPAKGFSLAGPSGDDFFPSCLFFFSCFSFVFWFFFSSSVPCRLCGAGVVCVSWAVGCACVCFGGAVSVVALFAVLSHPSGAGWCCVALPVVFGCLLLGLAVLCCLLSGLGVVFRWCCPCLAAWLAVLWFGAVCLVAPLPCIVFCGVVLSCGGALSCSAVCLCRCLCLLFVSCRCASAVCVLGCRAVCSLSSPPCAELCCAVLVSAWSVLFLVPGAVGSWCRRLFLGVCCRLWLPGVVIWRAVSALVSLSGRVARPSASSLWCPAPLCCVLWRRAAVWCCAVVPCRLFVLPCWWRWFCVSP